MRLNLGCGHRKLDGYVNADSSRECDPDLLFDLEEWNWPSEWMGAVEEVRLTHVLEHVGQDPADFLRIMKNLYRVCVPGALIYVDVPHPRSDGFLCDPTHVRPIMPQMLGLFSKKFNRETISKGWPNTPLGLMLGVDFEIRSTEMMLQSGWEHLKAAPEELRRAVEIYFNVVSDIKIVLERMAEEVGSV